MREECSCASIPYDEGHLFGFPSLHMDIPLLHINLHGFPSSTHEYFQLCKCLTPYERDGCIKYSPYMYTLILNKINNTLYDM